MTTAAAEPSTVTAEAAQSDILAPLRFFYGLASQDLGVTFMEGESLPAKDQWLLVHASDMTPRLAAYHGCGITLDVHAKSRIGSYLVRASILRRIVDRQPVEFGAIGIHLDGFDDVTREMILEGKAPLGGILGERKVPHSSHPQGFFQIEIDDRLADLLGGWKGQKLYGRCNELRHADGSPLAEVVEVLPDCGPAEA